MGLFGKFKRGTENEENTLVPKIHRFNKNIDGRNVIVHCNEALSTQAEFILDIIEEEQKKKDVLQNGYKIQIGWSLYFIIKSDDSFILNTPDFSKDPFADITNDVSAALLVQMQQNDILRHTKTQGTPVSFQDKLIILKDALNSQNIYFVREELKQGDSGWYLGLLNDDESGNRTEQDYISIYTYQLLELKPQLLKLLALPVGCIAVIKNNEIFEIVDSNNMKIL